MNFSRNRLAFKATVVSILIWVTALAFAADEKAPGDKVAVVNGVVISKDQFDRELDFFVKRAVPAGQQVPDIQMDRIKNDVLESLIVGELLFQESKKKGIQVKPDAVSKQLAIIKQRYPDENEFNKILDGMGLSESDVRAQLKRDMAIQQLIASEVDQKVTVTDEESKSYYDTNPQLFQQPERVRASHILIKMDADASDEQKAVAMKKIKEIQQKVQKGEDFSTLAKSYSEGPSSKNGGDLGFFRRGQMVKPFEDAAFSLKLNETSDIVQTRFGYHLIKVVDKKPEKKLSYAEIKDSLNKHLMDQKLKTERTLYFDKLKKDAKIEKSL
jgi:peptidyl-prolyl cis-trans isomerase C